MPTLTPVRPVTDLPSFTLTRRGEQVTFTTGHTIDSAAEALASSRSNFAHDLIAAHKAGRLTRNQAPWLLLLAEEAAPTVAKPDAPAPRFAALAEVVNAMQATANDAAIVAGRKAGKITLRFVGASISSVIQGPNKGCVYVKEGGAYMGKITQDGEFRPAYGIDPSGVIDALAEAQKDPTAAAIAYGRETGSCSCCGRELTNEVSIALGIGPICLERLGGAWG
jgi:hypothetical protein